MLEALSHMTLMDDALIILVGAILSAIFKVVLKPNRFEIRIISQLFSYVIVALIKWAADHRETIPHFQAMYNEVSMLKDKMGKKGKVALG